MPNLREGQYNQGFVTVSVSQSSRSQSEVKNSQNWVILKWGLVYFSPSLTPHCGWLWSIWILEPIICRGSRRLSAFGQNIFKLIYQSRHILLFQINNNKKRVLCHKMSLYSLSSQLCTTSCDPTASLQCLWPMQNCSTRSHEPSQNHSLPRALTPVGQATNKVFNISRAQQKCNCIHQSVIQ